MLKFQIVTFTPLGVGVKVIHIGRGETHGPHYVLSVLKTSSMCTGKDDKKKFHYSISPLILLHLGEIIHERRINIVLHVPSGDREASRKMHQVIACMEP